VPPGVPGELWIGGAGVARGYRGRPALTAQRFLPHPYAGPGERLYRTGDLGRRRPDGTLEYLRRADRQLKVRGFRVEPAEVEAVLAAHPDVRAAVVTLTGAGADARLTAHVVLEQPVAADALRAHAGERLPRYLVPDLIVRLDAFPLTANGKIDVRALPAPDGARPALGTEFVPAATDAERRLAEVFQDVLGVDRVGVDDDFFDLGGHSLLAVRASARVARLLGCELPVRTVFTDRTVRSLAARVEEELIRQILADP
jgi:hypothetical protein